MSKDTNIEMQEAVTQEEAKERLASLDVHVINLGGRRKTDYTQHFNGDPYDGKTSVRGNGNQHDFARGVEVKINEEYIRNGHDNYLPFDIINGVKRSTLQTRALETISALATGKMVFVDTDGVMVDNNRRAEILEQYKAIGIDNSFIARMNYSNYLFGGTPVLYKFSSDGFNLGLSRVEFQDYKSFRLSVPMWMNGEKIYSKALFHKNWGYSYGKRNKKITNTKDSAMSWIEWNRDPVKNDNAVMYYPMYNEDNNISKAINRCQCRFIKNDSLLNDHYPSAPWFSGSSFNYIRGEFELSCFDIDEIENGFASSGILYVYSRNYRDPKTGDYRRQLDKDKANIKNKAIGAQNSGNLFMVPMSLDDRTGKEIAVEGHMKYVPIQTNNTRDRHEVLDSRISKNILSANSAIFPELFGIRESKGALSDSSEKLVTGIKLLNQFAVIPLKELLDDNEVGLLNEINRMLGIEEITKITPNLRAFLKIDSEIMKHYFHPEQVYNWLEWFGIDNPSEEQINSGLIPAYRSATTNGTV